MKIVVIDSVANAIDFAQRIVTASPGVDTVYVFSSSVSPSIWNSDRLEVIEYDHQTASINTFIEANDIDLLINFDSLYGASGMLEQWTEKGLTCFGSDQAFCRTEINKREFKEWLKTNDFSTPDIIFEGAMQDIRKKLNSFTFPLVIKPDIQCGPKTVVCFSQDELNNYLATTIDEFPIAEHGVIFMIEEFIDSNSVMQVEYAIGAGKGFVIYSSACAYGRKSRENITGASCAYSPSPQFEEHRETIERFVNEMAKVCSAGVGAMQAVLDSNGELYILENNGRPSACRIWPEMKDPVAVINGLLDGEIDSLNHEYFYRRETCMASILMVHSETEKIVDRELLNGLTNIEFTPHSLRVRDGKTISVQGGPPSLFSVFGASYTEITDKLCGAEQTLKQNKIIDFSHVLAEIERLN